MVAGSGLPPRHRHEGCVHAYRPEPAGERSDPAPQPLTTTRRIGVIAVGLIAAPVRSLRTA